MGRAFEPEVEEARRRLFEAAERADQALRRLPWERLLLAAFAAGLVLGRVPAARALVREGALLLLRRRLFKG